MSDIAVSPEETREVLGRAEGKLKQYQAQGSHFQVNNAAETVARCHRLLGNPRQASRYFTMAAWASLASLESRLEEGEVELDVQWGYLFEALWLYYQAGNQRKARELASRLADLLAQWAEPIPVLQRIQATLAHYVVGESDEARALYQRFQLSRYEETPYHPEVKLLRAGLYGDKEAAHKAIEVSKREITDNGTQPWYSNNLEYDLISIAEALLSSGEES